MHLALTILTTLRAISRVLKVFICISLCWLWFLFSMTCILTGHNE
ncbi:hypothetical protein [Klebsiella phage 05F01]|nr:hypothetical protein [Klebsiella phage 05F01]